MRRKKKTLHKLLNTKADQRGFTLPLSIGVGISMLLIGTLMIARSNVDQTTAIAQVQTAGALSVAEAGVARTLSQLNSPAYAGLITRNYDQNRGDGREYLGADQILRSGDELTTITNQWDTASGCVLPTSSLPTSLRQGTVGTGANQGTYQVLAYRYNSTTRTGSLLVEGRFRGSTSRVQVSVNQRSRSFVVNTNFPGLYASNSIDLGNNDVLKDAGATGVSANVICRDCTIPPTAIDCFTGQPTTSGISSAVGRGPNSVIDGQSMVASVNLPPMPTAPTSAPNLGNINGSTTLPRPGDAAVGGVYHYVVNNIDLSGSNTLTINSTAGQVRLYVNGNVSFSGSASMQHTGTPDRLAIFGTAGPSANQTITLSGGSTAANAFVYAPNATVGINGGSASPDFRGAVWAKTWNGSNSNNAEIVVPDNMPAMLSATFGGSYAINQANMSYRTSTAPQNWSREGAVR